MLQYIYTHTHTTFNSVKTRRDERSWTARCNADPGTLPEEVLRFSGKYETKVDRHT